jgi:Ala-tRNA(Pro) deacylase
MATIGSIVDYLRKQKIPYLPVRHAPGYAAQREAALAHVQGRHWAKTVVCFADEDPIQAVVPAHRMVDFERLRVLLGARAVRLGTEAEIAKLYPDCELGAMPPFGSLYGQRVAVDASLVGDPEMVFNAGTHTEAISMHYNDYADIVKPLVGAIATSSGQAAALA